MAYTRLYTGDDGQSHFEDLDLLPPDLDKAVAQATAGLTIKEGKELLPQDLHLSEVQAATSVVFARLPDGRFQDWHTSPRRLYAFYLAGGQIENRVGDGTVRRMGPGDVMLAEDTTGQGHTAMTVGGDCLIAFVLLAD